MTGLVLHSSRLVSAAGGPPADDYEVWSADREIGRILLTRAANRATPWFWTITARVPQSMADRGFAATREDAMRAFKVAWLR